MMASAQFQSFFLFCTLTTLKRKNWPGCVIYRYKLFFTNFVCFITGLGAGCLTANGNRLPLPPQSIRPAHSAFRTCRVITGFHMLPGLRNRHNDFIGNHVSRDFGPRPTSFHSSRSPPLPPPPYTHSPAVLWHPKSVNPLLSFIHQNFPSVGGVRSGKRVGYGI